MGKVLVIFPPTAKHLKLFDDLEGRSDVVLFEAGFRNTNLLGRFLKKVHLSRKVNSIINLPNKKFWYRRIPFSSLEEDINTVLILDGALNYIDKNDLFRIKESRDGIQIYLLMINALDADSPSITGIKQYILSFPWDDILTFDPEDAKKYQMTYKGFCYYSAPLVDDIKQNQVDVFFIGGVKGGREEFILNIYNFLERNGVICDFKLMTYKKKKPVQDCGVTYLPMGWRPYEEVLSGVVNSKCILEILQSGQSGASLRYFEAVCYDRKLITNNPNIVSFPYYNPSYMKIITDIQDIDINWILSDEKVEYHYQGDFSPNYLIDSIKS